MSKEGESLTMPEPTGIYQEQQDKTSQPLKFPEVLFRQLDRILKALTEQSGNFMAGIEGFDMAVAFFKTKDKKFKDEITSIETEAEKYLTKIQGSSGQVDQNQMHGVAYARSKMRMEALLKLIGRAGFYPEQQREWVEK